MCFRKSFKWPVKFSLKIIMYSQCPFNADLKPLVRTQENVPVTFLFIHTHSIKIMAASVFLFLWIYLLINWRKRANYTFHTSTRIFCPWPFRHCCHSTSPFLLHPLPPPPQHTKEAGQGHDGGWDTDHDIFIRTFFMGGGGGEDGNGQKEPWMSLMFIPYLHIWLRIRWFKVSYAVCTLGLKVDDSNLSTHYASDMNILWQSWTFCLPMEQK